MKLLKNLLGIVVLTFTIMACKNDQQPEVKTVATATESNTEPKAELDPNAIYAMAEFTIEGMTCQVGCANTIEKKLAKLEGVKSAKVDFESKLAMVEFDKAKQNTNSLENAVTAVADVYTVNNMKTVNMNEAKADMKKCDANCTKACCKEKTEAEKKACSEACQKACCADKA